MSAPVPPNPCSRMSVGRGPCSEGRASRNVRVRPSTVSWVTCAPAVVAGAGAGDGDGGGGAGVGRASDGGGAGCGLGATGGVPK
jgi:hypothetical protein